MYKCIIYNMIIPAGYCSVLILCIRRVHSIDVTVREYIILVDY